MRARRIHCSVVVALVIASVAGTALAAKPKTFKTPEEAVQALVAAVEKQSTKEVDKIVGPELRKSLRVDEKRASTLRTLFLRGAKSRVSIEPDPENPKQKIAFIGESEWPFPAPLVADGKKWRFDGQAGVEEIIFRRIGRNELLAIEACRAYVDAQQEYAEHDHDGDGFLEFASRINSSPGRADGLYWSTANGEDLSPLGPFAAQAAASEIPAGGTREPLAGYYYRILTAQGGSAAGGARNLLVDGNLFGGFALVAWPATYGDTGIKTFIVNQLGQVYEKDLGSKTESLVESLSSYDPDASWTLAED